MSNNYYVYVYLDPRSTPPEPIYVGKGHNNRYEHHIKKGAKNKHLKNKLDKISKEGLTPIIEFPKKNISDAEAILLEIELIAKYGRIDKKTGTLCNWTNGGEGTSGYKHKDETKKLLSEQRKNKTQTPKQYEANCSRKASEETKKKISDATTGHRWHTKEQIKAIIKHNQTREITNEMREKWSKTRLGNTPTKINYPPTEELILMIETTSKNQVAKKLGITFSSLNKYLIRRGITCKDARFSPPKQNHQS